jgi:signal transduction histidine kinase
VNRVREAWESDRGRLAHYLVAVALATFLVGELATLDIATPGLIAGAVVAAVALLFTRDLPFVAPLTVLGALAVVVAIGEKPLEDTGSPFLVAILFTPWCFGMYNQRPKAIAGLVASEALGAWANWNFDGVAQDYFFVALFVAVTWTIGLALNRRGAHARELAERARRLEREQAAAAERAVAEERQRIARELHDVIAHSVSVMTVQAGAVRRLLKPQQEKERQALETIEATGREALTEMRRLVGLLREQGAMPEFAPQPGMATIDSLLESVRAAGLPVDLEVAGTPRDLPAGVDLAAYRVVQEALTNALKYAGPARAWVFVRWRPEELELEIANDGTGDGRGMGGGHGLAGMRERVSLYGGEIDAGERDGGGYVVRARLPIGGAAS